MFDMARAVSVERAPVDWAPCADALLLEDEVDAGPLICLEEPAFPEILVLEETGHITGRQSEGEEVGRGQVACDLPAYLDG